jgi:ribonuclease P protein component
VRAGRSSRIAAARAVSAWRPERRIESIDRIRDRAILRRFRTVGVRARRGPLTVVALERPDGGVPGMAYAVPRRVGSAVVRNRVRRRLRAAATELERDGVVPTAWYLVIVAPGAARSSYADLRRALRGGCADAAARLSPVHGQEVTA